MIQYITDRKTTPQFDGEVIVSLKISLMLKLVMEKIMIMLANTILLMTKSAILVTLKDKRCYHNVDATISKKFDYPFSLYLELKTCHKYPLNSVFE